MKIEINLDEKFFEEKFKENRAASFSSSMEILGREITSRSRQKKQRYPTWVLDSKIITHEFSKLLNVRNPKIYQVDCSIDDVVFLKNCVIKPMNEYSAIGVFIHDDKDLYYLNKNIYFKDTSEARNHAKKLIANGFVKKDKWMVEELVGDSNHVARDVKFYMFYGQVGLILESSRLPSLKRCWYDESFKIVETGKYQKSLFKGDSKGLDELATLAKSLSTEIPAPFVRIDFLQVNNEIYLGEFTPRPGNFSAFNNEWDKKLGDLFQASMVRLVADFGAGKQFEKYNTLNKSEKDIIEILKKSNISAEIA